MGPHHTTTSPRPPLVWRPLIVALVAAVSLVGLVLGPVAAGTLERQSGANRYATAAAVSRAAFPEPTSPVVYVATGDNYADALAAGPATHGDGPVLLVGGDFLPPETRKELRRLKPSRIVIAGGPSVVSSKVENLLRDFGAPVVRHWGPNRYATAAAISRNAFENPNVPVVYISTGLNFADALAAGAATQGFGPVLLVTQTSIPSETRTELNRLNPGRIVIAGGPAVVSNGVQQALGAFGAPVQRQSGANRYGTAAEISKQTNVNPNVSVIYIATGEGFADALAAGPAAIRGLGPILLVSRNSIPPETRTELRRLNPTRIVAVGGSAVISDTVVNGLAKYLAATRTSVDDSFDRDVDNGWGVASNGAVWARTIGPSDAFSVKNGSGRASHRVAGTTRQLEINPIAGNLDQQVTLRVQVPALTLGAGNDVHIHAIARRASGVDFYRLQVAFNGAGHISLLPQKVINRTPTGIGPQINDAIPVWSMTETYWIKFQAIGSGPTTLRGKVWRNGDPEPGAWAFSRTDSAGVLQSAATSAAFRSFLVNGYSGTTPVVVRVHDFVSEAAP